ncbi:MAG: hypothetical protein ACLFQA_03490 [Bacteroidales bacterium]
MSKKTNTIILVLSAFLLLTDISAQNNTYSPYSRFGIGDIAKNPFGRNMALGGTGFGLRDPNHINYLNPASNSAQDTMSFIFSTGITGNTMQLSTNEASHNVNNVTLSHLAIGFPVARWWKTNIGLTPYSQMGYNIIDVDLSQDSEHYYDGSGGINQFFFGNAVNITNNISAGINISYLFGTLNQNRELQFPMADDKFSVNSTSRSMVGDLHFRYGLQYSSSIRENYRYTLGVIYENKTPLRTSQDWLIINQLSTESGQVRDTIQHLTGSESSIELPANIGIGVSFARNNKFLVGADYSFQNWSETSFLDQQQDSLVNSSTFSMGAQYIPDHTDFRNYLNRIQYRLGFHYTNTYLQLRGHQLKDYGITLGFGFPYGNSRTSFDFSVDIGRRGTTDLNLIRENYVIFNLSLSLYDNWFFQRRYD